MAPGNKIPERWEDYTKIGQPIKGTRFIAFKVPLKEELCRNLSGKERFTPKQLIEMVEDLGHVIDLTNTKRYYDSREIEEENIGYTKILCPGQQIPPQKVVDQFFETADNFFKNDRRKGQLLGVHCTHGLNRTGYLVCKYMIDRLGIDVKTAISAFNVSRGHPMERENYINDLGSQLDLEDPITSIQKPSRPLGRGRALDRRVHQMRPITVDRQPNIPCSVLESVLRPMSGGRGKARPSHFPSVDSTVSNHGDLRKTHDPRSSRDNQNVFLRSGPDPQRDWSRTDRDNHRGSLPRAYVDEYERGNRQTRSHWNSYENDKRGKYGEASRYNGSTRHGSRDRSASRRLRYDEYSSRDRNRDSSRNSYNYDRNYRH